MTQPQRNSQTEPFFITEEVEATLIAAGSVFEPPPFSCAGRLYDVLEHVN